MKYSLSYYLCITILLFSCEKKKEQHINNVHVDYSTTKEITCSSFIDDYKLIKLSTSNENLIFQISKIIYDNERLFILDMPANCIYIFNNSGELEHTFFKQGAGPGEYIQLTDFYVEKGKLFVLDFTGQAILEYDHTFNFTAKTKFQTFGSSFMLQQDYFWIYNEPSGKIPDYQFTVSGRGEKKTSGLLPRNSTSHPFNWSGVNVFCMNGKDKYLSPGYNDTIYRIIDNNLLPEYYIDFKKRKFPDKDHVNNHDISDPDFFYLIKRNFYVSNKYLIFDYFKNMQRHYCIYDRKNKTNISGVVANDLISNFRFFPRWGNDNYLIEELPADILINEFSQSLELEHLIRITKEDDNPIIIIYILKE
jgi:hypothetical protein